MLVSMREFLNHKQGMSAIEFAIILPVASLILMGIVEFGVAGLKGQSLQRSLAAATSSVQADPLNQANFNLANSNTSLINFSSDGNYVCAQSYTTLEEAQQADCTGGWNTLPPQNGVANYFVLLKGQVSNQAITGLMDPFIGDISDRQVIGVGGSTILANVSCPPGQFMKGFDSNGEIDCEAAATITSVASSATNTNRNSGCQAGHVLNARGGCIPDDSTNTFSVGSQR